MEQDMEWKGIYKSELLMVCHKDAQAMYDVGAINDREMREFDRDCLVSPSKKSSDILNVPNEKPVSVHAESN